MAVATILLALFAVALTYACGRALYNITLHPLAGFPGPKLYGAFNFPWFRQALTGSAILTMKEFHEKYGDIVRYEPNSLSFIKSPGWNDINARRTGRKDLIRDPVMFRPPPGHKPSILLGNSEEDHTRSRRVLSHAFTEPALREQEPLIQKYCDQLVYRLSEVSQDDKNGIVNMNSWLNSTVFDILGDLAFGESFQALENGGYHPWMITILKSLELTSWFMCMNAYPGVSQMFFAVMNFIPSVGQAMKTHLAYNEKKVTTRVEKITDRKDFLSYILQHNDRTGLSQDELVSNVSDLILAGSQAGVFLSGMLFLLLKNPEKLDLLVKEITNSFKAKSEMNFQSEANLVYLNACIQEALRIYSPAPSAIPLMTPSDGMTVDGVYIPGNVSVSVHPYAAFHSKENFKDPEEFVPERWLGDIKYASDDRATWQPFGYGPKACLGKKLATAEVRSVMTRLFWSFKIELCEDSKNWMDQKGFFVWRTRALNVMLTERD